MALRCFQHRLIEVNLSGAHGHGSAAVPLLGRYFVSDLHHKLSAHLYLHGLYSDERSALAQRLTRSGYGLSGRRSHCLR
jgi:hypothetical protein